MGIPIGIDVRGAVASAALDRAFAWLRWVDATFSTYDPASEISRLNAGELALADAQPLVREVLAACEDLRGRTGGAFDARAAAAHSATSGGGIDPSGYVKGWAVERAGALLEAAGARHFCIDAGGDLCLRGGAPWRVGIRHPIARDRLAAVIHIADGAVATSGAYERGAHIVDPRSGRPAAGALSVTVVGPDLALADAFATAAFALGRDGPAWTATLPGGYGAMTILEGERVLCTPAFLRRCPGGSVAASLEAGGA